MREMELCWKVLLEVRWGVLGWERVPNGMLERVPYRVPEGVPKGVVYNSTPSKYPQCYGCSW